VLDTEGVACREGVAGREGVVVTEGAAGRAIAEEKSAIPLSNAKEPNIMWDGRGWCETVEREERRLLEKRLVFSHWFIAWRYLRAQLVCSPNSPLRHKHCPPRLARPPEMTEMMIRDKHTGTV
jgi:hypothetical protein